MKPLQLKKKLTDHCDFILLSLIVTAMPFKLNYVNFFLITAFIFSLHKLVLQKKKAKLLVFYATFPFLFFLITLFSALTSKNVALGMTFIDKNLLLLLIPTVLIVLTRNGINLNKLLFIFVISNVVATTILIVINIVKYGNGLGIDQLFFHEFTQLYNHHPVYYSLNLAMSAFIFNDLYFKRIIYFKHRSIVFFSFTAVLLTGIFFCSSKIIMTLFVVLYMVQLLLAIKKKKNKLITIFSLIVTLILISNVNYVQKRFNQGISINFSEFQPVSDIRLAKKFSYPERKNISDLDHRLILAKIGVFHLIDDGKLLTGYGIGDVQNYLDYYYMSYGLAPNWFEGHNTHNQYLQILITYGLVVFCLFMLYLTLSSYKLIKSKKIVFIYFVLMVLTAFCFESYLMRNKGIVFLYFFLTIFLIDLQKKHTQ